MARGPELSSRHGSSQPSKTAGVLLTGIGLEAWRGVNGGYKSRAWLMQRRQKNPAKPPSFLQDQQQQQDDPTSPPGPLGS